MTARRVSVAAPAKVNLGLRCVGRRGDGYHELESVFAPLDLCDRLSLELHGARGAGESATLELCGELDGVPAGAANLATRAAERFVAAARLRARVHVRLEKRLPVAAGLGGGSSDAGAVLRGLRELAPAAIGRDRLAALALELGADVPFFLDPRPARVSGVGERIEPIEGLAPLSLVLARPRTPLSTKAVFAVFDAGGSAPAPPAPPAALSRLRRGDGRLDPGALAQLLANDLEPAATRLCPALPGLRDAIQAAGALAVGMSGSGPTLFGVFENDPSARAGRHALRASVPEVWARVASTIPS